MAYRIFESGPVAATGNLVVLNVLMEHGVTLAVDDNGGGSTITVETSPDNSVWTAFAGGYRIDPTSGAVALAASTFTSKGVFFFPIEIFAYIRFRVSTYVSGYVRVRWEETTHSLPVQPGGYVKAAYKVNDYTCGLGDANAEIIHPASDGTARTFTIPSKAQLDYPINTAISFINQNGAGAVTIAINSDTMRLAGAGTTGSRTLAANGVATAIKIAATEWIISGSGLT